MVAVLATFLMASSIDAQTATSKSAKSKSSSKQEKSEAKKDKATAEVPAALNFTMKSIDGEEVDLSKYQGNVVMFVNVASKCGMTPQYEPLQKLHEKYAEQGLSIIGIPCNQFGGQEPGTEAEIAKFCTKNYGVEFDMLSKVDVKGDSQCELFELLTSLEL